MKESARDDLKEALKATSSLIGIFKNPSTSVIFLPSADSLNPILPDISSPNLGLAEITFTAPDVEFLPNSVP